MTREEAIKMLKYNSNVIHRTINGETDPREVEALDMAVEALEKESRKGHWIEHIGEHSTYYECSKCGCLAPCSETATSFLWKLSNFCPDCGAEMVEPLESENEDG